MNSLTAFGVNDRGQYYFLQTAEGSIIRFSNDGVDGVDFADWPAHDFTAHRLAVNFQDGQVCFEAVRGNHRVTIPLGRIKWSSRLRTWLSAVNACLPQP